MDTLIATAASGMRSRLESLDVLANNLANSNTSGYKADQEAYQLYFGAASLTARAIIRRPSFQHAGSGSRMDRHVSRNIDGHRQYVGRRASWTRLLCCSDFQRSTLHQGGSFRISKQGQLATQEGFPVLGVGGKPIALDASKPWTVSQNGTVTQSGTAVGTLQVVTTNSPAALVKRGGNYFALEPGNNMSPVADPSLVQGKVEGSNVPAPQAAVKLVGVMRQFEMLQKAVRMAGDMNKQAVEQVAKVSS